MKTKTANLSELKNKKAILVGLNVEDKDNFMTIEDSMRELQDLAETCRRNRGTYRYSK